MDNPLNTLSDLLSEMQRELSRRAWTENLYDRIEQASDFRGKMFEVIEAYAQHCVKRGF